MLHCRQKYGSCENESDMAEDYNRTKRQTKFGNIQNWKEYFEYHKQQKLLTLYKPPQAEKRHIFLCQMSCEQWQNFQRKGVHCYPKIFKILYSIM